jgi:hypothetical protein
MAVTFLWRMFLYDIKLTILLLDAFAILLYDAPSVFTCKKTREPLNVLNNGNWKVLDGSGRCLIEVLSQNLPRRTEDSYWKISIRTTGVPDGIRTEYLPNTNSSALLPDELGRYLPLNHIVELSGPYHNYFISEQEKSSKVNELWSKKLILW